ncbi:hypothetical protein ILUMI_12821 [Ignelater luminosus]|uniref:C2H2-type domain-containing protein n=1 Tax=Ignelater luminosus TaxID=2038154 RepID=A0A8K0D221_IGNLU|nr:hypothetical protein ILUMI_12821 [Ignelater luminosus]
MKVCRTCLQVLNNDAKCLSVDTNDCSMEPPSIRRKLLMCIPEMELDVQQQVVIICMPCSIALNTAYDFKNKCLQTEERISSYVQYVGCSKESVNMFEVVNFNEVNNDSDPQDVKPQLADVHYPITQIIEQDSDVDIKPIINSCDSEFSQSYVHESKNFGANIKVQSENSACQPINNSLEFSLPDNVIFSPELDVEVRGYRSSKIDIFNEGTNSSLVNNCMETNENLAEVKLECPYCSKTFLHTSELDAHVSSHMENRPLKCTECERRFVRKDKLQLHMRTHTGEKPFECTLCGRCFSRKDKLNNHMRTHTGEKPHQCILCLKSFARKDKMNTHMKSQHWLMLANLEITVVKNNGLVNNVTDTNTTENPTVP